MSTIPDQAQSARHSTMLANHLLPSLERYFAQIVQIKDELLAYPEVQLAGQWPRKEKQILDLLGFFTEDNLNSEYEAQVSEEGIRDNNPFLREKAIKLYFECATYISEYAHTLIEFVNNKIHQQRQVSRKGLLDEILSYPELKSLATQVIEQLVSASNKPNLPKSDSNSAIEQAQELIVTSILTEPNYGIRLPHLTVALVNEDIGVGDWYQPLLNDITQSRDILEAAEILLGGNAHNQILLSSNLSLELQKEAQEKQAQAIRFLNQREAELMQLNGDIEDLKPLYKLGRWKVLEDKLNYRIHELKNKIQAEQQFLQERQLKVINQVNTLDIRILSNNAIPLDIKQEIQRGLYIIRQAVVNNLTDGISTFIKDIAYRLDHGAWSISELSLSVDQLQRDLEGKSLVSGVSLGVERVCELLERNELSQLGFSENQIALSNVETRCNLLDNWIRVRDISSFHTIDMTNQERQAISALYRYFAMMVAMQQVKTPSGDHIWDESVSPYGLYQLTYPKTNVLNTGCVFITLPGHKPRAKHRQALQELVSGKEWLPDYFIVVFIPGCTPELKMALQSEYRKQGLVIIDEQTIVDIVLAETYNSKPVGKLRSLMLNSKPLEFIDIFKINQLVDIKASIFVGRDYIVEQVASSGDNYALYGGRRIGKSSVLNAVRDRLNKRGEIRVITFSFEGRENCSDNMSAIALARELQLPALVHNIDDLRVALENYMDANSTARIVILFDEIDKYIDHNPNRHLLIETTRSLSERYVDRFRVIVAGFMRLYDCMQLRGPYTPTSDPWGRMFKKKLLDNLTAESAERIVREGFIEILGWDFQHRSIPQGVVERTGGHPAFVQKFCEKLQQYVAKRSDKLVKLDDLEVVFDDRDPEDGFMSYVRHTLSMNLDPVARFVILWLAKDSKDIKSFRFDQLREYANLLAISEDILKRSIEHLIATSVLREIAVGLYEFTVPDYPIILSKLGDTNYNFDELEEQVRIFLVEGGDH